MEQDDNVNSHINKMCHIFERFDALISPQHPLVPDDIFAAALIISLTPDLLKVVRPLKTRSTTTSDDVIQTISQDDAFAKTRRGAEHDASASRANI